MESVILELIVAVREIKEILALHAEEINRLKKEKSETPHKGGELDERLVKLALEGSKNLYMQSLDSRMEKRLDEIEAAIRHLSEKAGTQDIIEREVAEEHLNRLKKALAE